MFTLGVLLAEIWILRKIFPGPSESFFTRPESVRQRGNDAAATSEGVLWTSFFRPPQFIVAAAILVLTLGVYQTVDFREKIPASRPFSQFPLAVGSWEGTRQFMEQMFITELDLSDYTMIDYKSGNGRHVDFYVAYYESQRKAESIHSPETCLPGSGWIFRQAGQAKVPIAGQGGSITVNRAIMEKSGAQQISYFWFPARGRILTNAWELKIYTFWDALTRQRTDGALVRVITAVSPDENIESAEARLQDFTRQIVPVLDGFIPK
jgi:EpsI family protein